MAVPRDIHAGMKRAGRGRVRAVFRDSGSMLGGGQGRECIVWLLLQAGGREVGEGTGVGRGAPGPSPAAGARSGWRLC